MAYTPLQVSIPAPCHEDWNRMTPVGRNQRHCGSCAKNVTDFSWMTDREIHQFLAVAGNHLCGRFRADQLERPIRALVKPVTGWRSLAAAGGLLLSAGMSVQAMGTPSSMQPVRDFTALALIPAVRQNSGQAVSDTLRGRVVDSTGEPLVGVTVLLLGTTTETVTDFGGRFSLTAAAGQRVALHYIGFEELDFTVASDDSGYSGEGKIHTLVPQSERYDEAILIAGIVMIDQPPAIPPAPVETPAPVADDEDFEAGFTVSPNPFTDRLNVEFRGADVPIAIGTVSAQLFNVNGQLLRVWPARTHEAGELSLSFPTGDLELVPGPYILRLTDAADGTQSLVVLYH